MYHFRHTFFRLSSYLFSILPSLSQRGRKGSGNVLCDRKGERSADSKRRSSGTFPALPASGSLAERTHRRSAITVTLCIFLP